MGARLPRSFRKANYNCKFFPRVVIRLVAFLRGDESFATIPRLPFFSSSSFCDVGSREEVSLASAGVQSKIV